MKLIFYGRRDTLFREGLQSEKAVHYSYRAKLDSKYEENLTKKYEELFGQKVDKIQDRFIFNLDGAAHSLHMQKRFNAQIKKAIQEYLQIIN